MNAHGITPGVPAIEAWIEIDGGRVARRFHQPEKAREWLARQIGARPDCEMYGIDRYEGTRLAEVIFQCAAEREALGLGDEPEHWS